MDTGETDGPTFTIDMIRIIIGPAKSSHSNQINAERFAISLPVSIT